MAVGVKYFIDSNAMKKSMFGFSYGYNLCIKSKSVVILIIIRKIIWKKPKFTLKCKIILKLLIMQINCSIINSWKYSEWKIRDSNNQLKKSLSCKFKWHENSK